MVVYRFLFMAQRDEAAIAARSVDEAGNDLAELRTEAARLAQKLEETNDALEQLQTEAECQRDIANKALAAIVDQSERLGEINRAKSGLMAGISSQFRTPLTLTISPLEQILERHSELLDTEIKEELELALRNARRLMLIVGQLVDISKVDAGRMSVQPAELDVRDILRDLSLSFTPWAERKQISFHLELPDNEVRLHVDPYLLKRALVNLTTASFKVTPGGGTVRITLSEPKWQSRNGDDGAFACVRIRDTGPGIPSEDLPYWFDRFHPLTPGRTTELSRGLEASLAKDFIELNGGFVEIQSEVGFGTEILVYLRTGGSHFVHAEWGDTADGRRDEESGILVPGMEFDEMPPEGEDSDVEIVRDVTTVLVVEDNEDVRTLLRRILEPGLRVVEARDGTQGLDMVKEVMPDLVLSDVMMPGVDGFELCNRIKSDPELAFIPVILLTAKAELEDRIEGLRGGADDYVVKPFDRHELKARVENLIAQRKRIKDRFSRQLELHASDIEVVSEDETFIRNVRGVIEAHIDDEDFSVEEFADSLGMSRGHLHRRLKSLLHMSPSEAIRKVRLERAQRLLEGHAGTVSEVAYQVGFRSVSHFCRCFKDAFGQTPAQAVASAERGSLE